LEVNGVDLAQDGQFPSARLGHSLEEHVSRAIDIRDRQRDHALDLYQHVGEGLKLFRREQGWTQ
jgi:hypothetical protein